ncbi:VOC family protein [Mycolicibacterium sp. P9-64]|uniref:VOC family protein n=1 Tax=Mycolicibacterium sp. P9-64 TaxID=2024612 RepID=UPI0011EF5804|nr:VOC family protein [Mycolicibacterium sp. P9-64]KAA0082848.1 VOC family protein [Mycolicibacterium sp. P9-64]
MANRTVAPLGAPIWIDLATSDLDRTLAFYGSVFGWTFESAGEEYGGYVNAFCDGRPVAGLMANDPQWGAPDAWTTYLHTADVDATVAAAVDAGATSILAPMDIPAQGRMAILGDPTCAAFGLWQPAEHHGFEVVNESGAPVWHQLSTRDFGRAVDFYVTVFGWQMQVEADTPEFRYSNAIFNGGPLLGVMDLSIFPEGAPSTWTPFLGADDVDKTVELITDNGGAVVRAAEDTPYGRLAAVTDPTGAAFNLSSLRG